MKNLEALEDKIGSFIAHKMCRVLFSALPLAILLDGQLPARNELCLCSD